MIYLTLVKVFVLLLACNKIVDSKPKKPHIVFVLADDLGFNDVGYNAAKYGSDMRTPFIDSLAMEGIRLENYYVQEMCTPSRSQLLSGKYQIHTGLQHQVIFPLQPHGLPLNNVLLPEQLQQCGYSTHMVGKWHIGFYKTEYLPWNRGFDTFSGFLNSNTDYYNRVVCGTRLTCGFDQHTEEGPDRSTAGEYAAHLHVRKAKEIIDSHDQEKPLFLYLALQSVHSPMQVPEQYSEPYSYINDTIRQIYAGMITTMDESVKNITEHLKETGMWDDTLFIFSTDNGGQPSFGGNNWPLRGSKQTLWEGGIKAVGFVHGKMLNINKANATNHELFHVSDWYPTLLSATECSPLNNTLPLDGVDQWKTISENAKSSRTEILHNIDPLNRVTNNDNTPILDAIQMGFDTAVQAAIRVGDWKLLTGQESFNDWVKPPEWRARPSTEENSVGGGFEKFENKLVRLYNIKEDPSERKELSNAYPEIVDSLLLKLAEYNSTAEPVSFPRRDFNADPKYHDNFWQPWLDSDD